MPKTWGKKDTDTSETANGSKTQADSDKNKKTVESEDATSPASKPKVQKLKNAKVIKSASDVLIKAASSKVAQASSPPGDKAEKSALPRTPQKPTQPKIIPFVGDKVMIKDPNTKREQKEEIGGGGGGGETGLDRDRDGDREKKKKKKKVRLKNKTEGEVTLVGPKQNRQGVWVRLMVVTPIPPKDGADENEERMVEEAIIWAPISTVEKVIHCMLN
ncbi:G-patch domain-containing protein [Reticulomyxa filosa]|uniref:G-patch domain-containing protein n=1 Tax=Reticulomyxa filosa TaxID=46433 RepID=X6NQE8_RETFI|nr:G-patch domain-containing protein [Reticulomyxa filosa]|eukprot:ETO28246.1 G-patch domain-containing protein [Reticulomyxa filosa]